jgi:hypothetical protein
VGNLEKKSGSRKWIGNKVATHVYQSEYEEAAWNAVQITTYYGIGGEILGQSHVAPVKDLVINLGMTSELCSCSRHRVIQVFSSCPNTGRRTVRASSDTRLHLQNR